MNPAAEHAIMIDDGNPGVGDLATHLSRQIAFSRGTFGPDERQEGVLQHIEQEIEEVRKSDGTPSEWVDLVILSFDGLWRSISARYPDWYGPKVARAAARMIWFKQSKNEWRIWPDWRGKSTSEAIGHVQGIED